LKSSGVHNVSFLELDVANPSSIEEASKVFGCREERLDVLINNAAISGAMPQRTSTIDMAVLRAVLETNFCGPIAVTQIFLPFLRKATIPRIINVSSELGSLTYNTTFRGDYIATNLMAYSCSKTALNSFTAMLANEFSGTNFKINSVTPGFSATDLTGNNARQTAEQGAAVIVRYALMDGNGPTGKFFRYESEMPW
jgi:NAD(P)-dependent dehydrogenase (short-subunit alcohol dehydrogenase family)